MYFFAGGRGDCRKSAKEGVGGEAELDGERAASGRIAMVESRHEEAARG